MGIEPALRFKHVSISQTIAGREIETRGEVGLLTRNVRIQGSEHDEWNGTITACPAEFDPDQFATQTCFDGRFGQERESDEFGVQIMIHSDQKDQVRISTALGEMNKVIVGLSYKI